MTHRFVVWLGLLLLALPAHAEEGQEGELEALRARVAELEKERLGLQRQIAELYAHLERSFAGRAGGSTTIRHSFPFDGEPTPAHLKGVQLPEGPTKNQVREYVARILREAGHHRGGFGGHDPEVPLLKRVGSEHVDVLTEPLLYGAVGADLYVYAALDDLVTPEHKDLILSRLHMARGLVQVVVSRGWIEDAAPTLLRVLADHPSWKLPYAGLPREWIEAVVALRRPESYGDLRAYLYGHGNRYGTWKAIRALPGVVSEADGRALWEWGKDLEFKFERANVAAIAAHYGIHDALEALFEDPYRYPQAETLERLTPLRLRDAPPDPNKVREWFRKHRDLLVFDAVTGVYKLEE